MPILRTIKDKVFQTYCRTRNRRPIWYHLLNREPKHFWRDHKPKISALSLELINSLKRDGIAVTDMKTFFPDIPFEELKHFADESLKNPDIQVEISQHEQMVRERVQSGGQRKGARKYVKDFIVEPYGCTAKETVPDIRNPYIRINLDDRVLGIAGSYMELAPKFCGFSLRVTLPVPAGAAEYFSQRWHRDPEDRNMLKIFIYMTDVRDEASGPFIYIKGSQPGGTLGHVFRQCPPAATYPSIGAVEKVIDPVNIKTCFGNAGTIIFADTSGLHKGGYTTTQARLMYTGTFWSSASLAKHHVGAPENVSSLTPLARFALQP